MIRTVLLIQHGAPLYYFANRLREASRVELVVIETGRGQRPALPRSPAALAEKLSNAGLNRLRAAGRRRAETAVLDATFGNQWRTLHPELPVLEVENINDPTLVARVKEIAPDVVLDHGTSIVKQPLIAAAPLTLNLHWGLSPWYRGVRCTEWALLHWDPYYIGVTIHNLSPRIDGGDIVAQARVPIAPGDTVHAINMRLTQVGTDLAADILRRMAAGESIAPLQQDLRLGMLTNSRQWSPDLDRHIRRIEREGWIARMLERPSRR